MDEAQSELTKDLVKFKIFDTEEECQEWKNKIEDTTGKIWGDVLHAPDGRFYTAYSRAGELASEAVTEAGEYYKLNVPLTAGYMIARNWRECH